MHIYLLLNEYSSTELYVKVAYMNVEIYDFIGNEKEIISTYYYTYFMHYFYLLCHSIVINYQLTSALDDACSMPMNYENSSFLPPTCNAEGSPSAQTGTIPPAGLFNFNLLSIVTVVIFQTAKIKIYDNLNNCDISYLNLLLDAYAVFVCQVLKIFF